MFNLDIMTLTYILVLAANLALILLVGNLAAERAREAWAGVVSRSRQTQTQIQHLKDSTEAAAVKTAEVGAKIKEVQRKLAETEKELAAVRHRQDTEPLPFIYTATPPENFDPGGTIWEFVVHHENESHAEANPDHHARHWLNGRLYQVQAATQVAARRQLERHLPEAEGFRITLVRQQGDALLAQLAAAE